MALFHDSAIVGASGNQGGTGGYQISRSLRFNSADSAYLSRTPASAGNRKTWTWSGWVKRSKLGTSQMLIGTTDNNTSSGNVDGMRFTTSDKLELFDYTSGYRIRFETTQVFRDLSAWYHILLAVDTTQSTSTNRIKIYVNGTQINTFDYSTYPSQNLDTYINNNQANYLAAYAQTGTGIISYFDGYLADIHFIDGQALTPSSFAETNATTGQWVPKAYTGAYGTNGFRLAFADNSNNTATTLGKDTSGNGNNWTPNNLSVTAGAGNDSLVDTPTSYGTDTGAGGEVRGNYCTWNPLRNDQAATLSNGNLELSTAGSTNRNGTYTTIGVTTGKWYWEITAGSLSTDGYNIGIASSNKGLTDSLGSTAESYIYLSDGSKRSNGVSSSYGATYTAGDVIGVALDLDAASLTFYKNGASQGTAFTGIPVRYWFPTVSDDSGGGTSGSSVIANFGQRSFAYTAPSGFKALCDTNLPAPTIAKPSTVMDVKLYTGNGSTQTISGLEFSPDFVWLKCRNVNRSHRLSDAVRGSNRDIYSDTTAAEAADGSITAFTSNGFNLNNATGSAYNASGESYVSWCWDAGSSTVTNTSGTISSQVSANASAGFSIVTYTGNGTDPSTIGHGLGIAPSLIIVKGRTNAFNWAVYHRSLSASNFIYLNSTGAAIGSSAMWNTEPTSSVFSVGNQPQNNASSTTYVAYCFAPVAGYSAFGSYTGNGSTDGPFVFTGFRPAFVLVKGTGNGLIWTIEDNKRDTYNGTSKYLQPQSSDAEGSVSAPHYDFTSNGFKIRTTDSAWNQNGITYIYAAFAESPFQYARAR